MNRPTEHQLVWNGLAALQIALDSTKVRGASSN